MELRQLEALEEVLRTGSFAGAARARHITQPALWAQVKGLERDLGVTLFVRVGRGIRPTPACLALRPRLRVALDDVVALQALAREVAQGREAPARIGTAPSAVPWFLAGCLEALRRKTPAAPFPVIVPVTSETAAEQLHRGALDLVIMPRGLTLGVPGTRLYDIWPAVLGPVVRGRTIDVRALDDVPVATLPKDSGLRTTLDEACRSARVHLRVVYEDRDARSLLALARRGLCTVVAPSEMIDLEDKARSARLVSGSSRFTVELGLFWRDEDALSPAARALRDVMLREARRRRR
jgi:DNA-binding transcriptional LysR family regulator